MAVGKDRKDMTKTKCYFVYEKMEEVTEDVLFRAIEGYGSLGYPIYINVCKPDICIYTAVLENCVLLIGCRVYNNSINYTVDDIKKLNRLGIVGNKIYRNCTIEV